MHRFMLDVIMPKSTECKTYSFVTWDHRSTMIKQLPSGSRFRAYEQDWVKKKSEEKQK